MDAELNTTDAIIEKAKISEAAGTTAFMEPKGKEEKRKPGRPAGYSPKKKESDGKPGTDGASKPGTDKPKINIPTKVLCYPIVKVGSIAAVNFVDDRRAAFTADEAESLAESLGMIIDKYMPDLMQSYGPEAVLAISVTQIGMRLYALKKVKQEEALRAKPQPMPQAAPQNQQGVIMPMQNQDFSIP